MPQRAASAPGSFQRLMQRVTEGLTQIKIYLDDAIAHHRTPAEHVYNIRAFLLHLRQHNL